MYEDEGRIISVYHRSVNIHFYGIWACKWSSLRVSVSVGVTFSRAPKTNRTTIFVITALRPSETIIIRIESHSINKKTPQNCTVRANTKFGIFT